MERVRWSRGAMLLVVVLVTSACTSGSDDDAAPASSVTTEAAVSEACGANVVDGGAVPGGVLAWSTEDEDVVVDDLDDGGPPQTFGEPGVRDLDPDLSPDGVVAYRQGPDPDTDDADIVVVDRRAGSPLTNLTRSAADANWGPAWSPDGQRIAFSSTRDSGTTPRVWVMDADGSDPHLITPEAGEYPDWSPDGSQLVYSAPNGSGRYDVFTIELDQTGADPVQIVDDPDTDFFPAWSPDGEWIAFHRLDAGVFVVRPDGSDERRVSPDADAGEPVWAPDGRLGWSGPAGFSLTELDACTTIRLPDLEVGMFPSWIPRAAR